MNGPHKPRIALFAAPESSPAILFGLYDVLGSVGAVYPDMTTGESVDALLDLSIVAAQAEPFRCFGNVLVEPNAAIDDADRYDVIIVCDLYTPITTPHGGRFTREAAWLREDARRGFAHRLGLYRFAARGRGGSGRRPSLCGALGLRRPVRHRVPAGGLRCRGDPRPRHGV